MLQGVLAALGPYGVGAAVLAGAAAALLSRSLAWLAAAPSSEWVARRTGRLEPIPIRPVRQSWLSTMEREAREAGLNLDEAKILLFMAVSGAALFGASMLVFGQPAIAIFGLVAGLFVPRLWFRRMIAGRRKLFDLVLVEALERMSATLRSGGTAYKATEDVAENAREPIRSVFGAIVREAQAGQDLDVAYRKMADALASEDFLQVATGVALHQETGANLAEIVDRVASSVRARQRFAEHVGALTTEGRINANVLVAIPFLILGLMRWMMPEYAGPLFNSAQGILLILVCVVLIILGYVFVLRLTDVRM